MNGQDRRTALRSAAQVKEEPMCGSPGDLQVMKHITIIAASML